MRRTLSAAILFLPLALTVGCSPGGSDPAAASAARSASPPVSAPAVAVAGEPLVIFLGDSLTAGLGLGADQAYPLLVEKTLEKDGHPVRVINAGVSGDTTAGGLARLDWLLSQKPDVVVIGLGGNDGLRGLPLEEAEQNLREIVRRSKEARARVLLLGMQIPPNYGPEYTKGFAEMYPRIARELDVPLIPFLLEGVGGIERLNQADGIHPTAEGQVKVAATVAPYVERMLSSAR
jgi:acyl-CoA thioesterase-1